MEEDTLMKETTHLDDIRLDDIQMWKRFFCHSVLPERPLELLLRGAGGGDVDGEQELLEVDVAVLVRVEGPEDRVISISYLNDYLYKSRRVFPYLANMANITVPHFSKSPAEYGKCFGFGEPNGKYKWCMTDLKERNRICSGRP